jgi:hypothetical protein
MVGCDWRWTSLVPGGPWVAGAGVAVMKPDLPQACAIEMTAGGRTGHQLDRAKLGPMPSWPHACRSAKLAWTQVRG